MEIREIKKIELDQLLELYKHLHEKDGPLPDKESIKKVWEKIQGNEELVYFGVFTENQLICSCTLTLVPNLTRGCRPYGIIENVVTHKAYRRRGYGQRILKRSLDFAWSKNCYKVMLLTGRLNEEIFNFYESAGFNRHSKQAFIAKP